MILKGLLEDRKPLIAALEKETGQKAIYCGPPGFHYKVGDHTVLRDGSLESTDEALMKKLASEGLVERTDEEAGIHFPLTDFTGRTLVNLVYCISAREKLLNKALDHPNAFHMGVGLVRALKAENPATIGDFMEVLYRNGGEKAMKGVKVGKNTVSFPGFPDTLTFRTLADLMVRFTKDAVWIKPKMKEPENEKYSFRVWLMAIGMNGPEYKKVRAELLSRFEGDTAFRTQEQRTAWEQKKKKPAAEPDFIVL